MKMKAKSGKKTAVKSLIRGMWLCVCMNVGLCAIAAGLIAAGQIREEYSEYICILVLFISSFAGSMTVMMRGEQKNIWLPLVMGLIYTAVLGLTGLLMFHRTTENAATITMSIMAGSILTFILINRKGRERRRRPAARYR